MSAAPRAIANPDCKFCGGLGFYAAGIRLREVECGNCIAAFERSVTDKLTAKQIFARAGEIASARYPNGCGSATALANIVTEAIDEFIASAMSAVASASPTTDAQEANPKGHIQ